MSIEKINWRMDDMYVFYTFVIGNTHIFDYLTEPNERKSEKLNESYRHQFDIMFHDLVRVWWVDNEKNFTFFFVCLFLFLFSFFYFIIIIIHFRNDSDFWNEAKKRKKISPENHLIIDMYVCHWFYDILLLLLLLLLTTFNILYSEIFVFASLFCLPKKSTNRRKKRSISIH
mgnify:CR=1 FL=1